MALTKVKNSNLDDADLVTLADNGVGTGANQIVQRDGSGDIPGVIKSTDIGTAVLSPTGDGSGLTGVDSLPSQTNQSGKFLTTDGSVAAWEATASVSPIIKPSITSPTSGAVDTAIAITFTGSAYDTTLLFLGSHASSVLEVASDSAFSTIVETITSGLESLTASSLGNNTQYFARMKYVSDNHTSEWSDVVSFTTMNAGILVPNITSPSNGATGILSTVSVSTDAYNATGHSEPHHSTTWQVATDSAFVTIISSSANDTVNLTSWNSGSLSISTTYYVRAMYHSSSYSSGWSSVISFTTAAVFSGEAVYTTAGTYNFIVPAGVSSVSVVGIGGGGASMNHPSNYSWRFQGSGAGALGWKNAISVTPGQSISIKVPNGGGFAHSHLNSSGNPVSNPFTSYWVVTNTSLVGSGEDAMFDGNILAGGGGAGTGSTSTGGAGGQKPTYADGGGNGGNGGSGNATHPYTSFGGGAGGYTGNGGNGGQYNTSPPSGHTNYSDGSSAGAGGGAGGGVMWSDRNGTGIFGQGASGAIGDHGSVSTAYPDAYGMGNGSSGSGPSQRNAYMGGDGAIRIIWGLRNGSTASFPNNASAI